MEEKQPAPHSQYNRVTHLKEVTIVCLSLFFTAFVMMVGCSDMETPLPDEDIGGMGQDTMMIQDTMSVMDTMPVANDPQYLELDSDYIFDQDKLPTFYLELSEENLRRINDDPAAEEYVEGSLTFEGETISPVGIRYKGSIGAFVGCVSGNDWSNPSGSKTCTKLSMKIKINWEGRTDKFYGLKKVQLHAMNLDPSQMRDRLGYWMFREMGVPAPRCIHARLFINGEYNGLFALIEQIDGRFTRYNWDDGKGNLYKEIWPLNSDKEAFSDSEYLAALETNEDENPSVEIIRDFGAAIAAAPGPSEIRDIIESHMDIREVLSYCVVDRAIKHDDGPFHWYCGGGECSSHNFFWYEEPESRQLHLIAWDLDNAFENITSENPVTHIPDDWGETRNNCQPFRYGPFFLQQKSAACDPLTAGWASYESEYEEIRDELVLGPLSESLSSAQLNKWSAQIREATESAYSLHDDAVSIGAWENAIGQLQNQLEIARR